MRRSSGLAVAAIVGFVVASIVFPGLAAANDLLSSHGGGGTAHVGTIWRGITDTTVTARATLVRRGFSEIVTTAPDFGGSLCRGRVPSTQFSALTPDGRRVSGVVCHAPFGDGIALDEAATAMPATGNLGAGRPGVTRIASHPW